MVDMEPVRQFNSELSTIYETKPPISKGKVSSITRLAVKAIKYYKHVVQSVEKFTQKCRQEYKVPALYIIDSIIRQSRHQFGADKDVFGPRFGKSITNTFQHLYKCPVEDQGKIVKVLNLWQKGGVYPPEVVQPLLNMAQQQQQDPSPECSQSTDVKPVVQAGNGNFVSVLQQQQQQHLEQIELLRRQLQEQQSINQQQQQQLAQQQMIGDTMSITNQQMMPGVNNPQIIAEGLAINNPQMIGNPMSLNQSLVGDGIPDSPQLQQGIPQEAIQGQIPGQDGVAQGNQEPANDQPRFQLQPHVLAQIQALTGMNIRIPQPNQDTPVQHNVPEEQNSWSHPNQQPAGMPLESNIKDQQMVDDFDYGDEQDDATRLAEQRRHLLEEERRLSQDQSSERDRHRNRSPRRRSQSPRGRRNRSPKRRSRSPRRRSRSPRGDKSWRSRSRERERGRDRERDRGRDREERRKEEGPEVKGPPPVVKDACSVCSNTIWVGHLAKSVLQDDLKEVFEEFGEITSIDMVPPRGCAYVQMAKREEATKAVSRLSNLRIHSSSVKLAWAPAKGVKDRKYKEYFNVELGVSYIPWDVLRKLPDVKAFGEGGWIDPESLPEDLKESLKETEVKNEEQVIPQVLPPQIPTHLPPPGHPMYQMMPPPNMLMRPPFPGGPSMIPPPEGMPWQMNIAARPPGFNQAVPHFLNQGGQQGNNEEQPFRPHLHPPPQESSGMQQFRPRFQLEGQKGGPQGQLGETRNEVPHQDFDGPQRGPRTEGLPRDSHNEGPPRQFDGPARGAHSEGPQRDFDGRPHDEGPMDFDGRPRGPHNEGPRDFDGPPRGHLMEGHPREFDGPPRSLMDGPPIEFGGPHRGHHMEGPPRDFEGHLRGHPGMHGGFRRPPFGHMGGPDGPRVRNMRTFRPDGMRFDGPPRGPDHFRHGRPRFGPRGMEGPPMRQDGPRFDGPMGERPPFAQPLMRPLLGPPRSFEGPPVRLDGPPLHEVQRPDGSPMVQPLGMPTVRPDGPLPNQSDSTQLSQQAFRNENSSVGPPRIGALDTLDGGATVVPEVPPKVPGANETGPEVRPEFAGSLPGPSRPLDQNTVQNAEPEKISEADSKNDSQRISETKKNPFEEEMRDERSERGDRYRREERPPRDRRRDHDNERSRSRDRERHRSRDRGRDRPRSRERGRARSRDREWSRDQSRDSDTRRSRDSDRDRERRDRDRRDRGRRDRDRDNRDRFDRDRDDRDRSDRDRDDRDRSDRDRDDRDMPERDRSERDRDDRDRSERDRDDRDRSDRDRDDRDKSDRDRDDPERFERGKDDRDSDDRDRRRNISDRENQSSEGDNEEKPSNCDSTAESTKPIPHLDNSSDNSAHELNHNVAIVNTEPLTIINNGSPEEGEVIEDNVLPCRDGVSSQINVETTDNKVCEEKIKLEYNSSAEAPDEQKNTQEVTMDTKQLEIKPVKEEVEST